MKQEEQKAEELAKQKKQQAVTNIRSHRASQKLRPAQSTAKGSKKPERKQSAKGGREGTANKIEKPKEEEKKEDKVKYHNDIYTY